MMAPPPQAVVQNQFDHPQPRPYSWKTDEFQTQNEPRQARNTGYVEEPQTRHFDQATQNFHAAAPLAFRDPQAFAQPLRCPHCASQMVPRIEKRISTAGWITFAVLLVFFFPLFWIGLLIKEEVPICQSCNSKLALGPYR